MYWFGLGVVGLIVRIVGGLYGFEIMFIMFESYVCSLLLSIIAKVKSKSYVCRSCFQC